MRILYVAMKHDYGKPEQGLSFEHWNFYDSLAHMGHTILYFDFMTLLKTRGREGMNRRLLEVARAEKPDLMFTVLFEDELDPAAVRRLSDGCTITLNWFCDDQWRFDTFSRRWTPCFSWVVTTAASALHKYESAGLRNVLRGQWACNHFLYRRRPDLPLRYDVTFVGQPHGIRRTVIEALRDAGLSVQVWGQGWDAGRLSQEQMIEVFNQSRINLNLGKASSRPPRRGRRAWRKARQALRSTLRGLADGMGLLNVARRTLGAARAARAGGGAARLSLETPLEDSAYPGQMKGRNFEVPGCGGLLMTDPAEDLERYYRPGREVVLFRTLGDLVDRARYYLTHEDERAAIATAGYERTLREHTYVHRFAEIFRSIGLPAERPEVLLAGPVKAGETVEID